MQTVKPGMRVRPPRCEHKEAEYLDAIQAAYLLELREKELIQYKTACGAGNYWAGMA